MFNKISADKIDAWRFTNPLHSLYPPLPPSHPRFTRCFTKKIFVQGRVRRVLYAKLHQKSYQKSSEIKFHLDCKLHFPSAQLMLRQMHLTNVSENIEAKFWRLRSKREYELSKLPLKSSFRAVTADSKSRWPYGKKRKNPVFPWWPIHLSRVYSRSLNKPNHPHSLSLPPPPPLPSPPSPPSLARNRQRMRRLTVGFSACWRLSPEKSHLLPNATIGDIL